MGRDLFTTTILALIAVSLGVGLWSYLGERLNTTMTGNEVPVEIEDVADRIVDFKVTGSAPDSPVYFAYTGEVVPTLLAKDEVPELRTENSYTRFLGTVVPGENPIIKVESVIYPQHTFVEDGNDWRYVEYGETTKEQFDQAMNTSPWYSFFASNAYAVDIYSGSVDGNGDGYVESGCICPTSWADLHAGNNTTFALASTTSMTAGAYLDTTGKIPQGAIYRIFIPINTSSIPAAATISAATFNVYAFQMTDHDDDGLDYVTVIRTSQSTHADLLASGADFDFVGTTEGIDSGQREDITTISTVAYTAFTLNATGISWIAKSGVASNCSTTSGYTCFGLREGHDNTNTAIAEGATNIVTFYTSEQTGTANDPYLAVTYTAPATTIFGPLFTIAGDGKFEVGSDGTFEISAF